MSPPPEGIPWARSEALAIGACCFKACLYPFGDADALLLGIPILLLGALALAALGSRLMGKKDQSFNGVIAQDFNTYEFYPGAKDCKYRGMPYVLFCRSRSGGPSSCFWLLKNMLPNERFHDIVTVSTDPEHMDRLFHGVWRAKLNGNLSRIGWLRYRKPYLRELSVNYVVDAVPLDCRDAR